MTNEMTTVKSGQLMHDVIVKGNLQQLSEADRTMYYVEVCKSVGLNPLTKPFEYITLNGKLVLYAKRDATDQLRMIHGVSVEELTETEREGVFIVTAKVKNRDGRTDIAKGAVNIDKLKGDALANALMKAETKAKRRATLSICGLGMLDETEIETIPQEALNRSEKVFKNHALRNEFAKNVEAAFDKAQTLDELAELAALYKPKMDEMGKSDNEYDKMTLESLRQYYVLIRNRIVKPKEEVVDDGEVPPFIQEMDEQYKNAVWEP